MTQFWALVGGKWISAVNGEAYVCYLAEYNPEVIYFMAELVPPTIESEGNNVMSIVTEKYTRKPFEVEVVRVTDENMDDVAKWCDGKIQFTESGKRYIKVDVNNPLTVKQTMAMSGDWVLKSGDKTGFKVYQNKAFLHTFEKIEGSLEGIEVRNPQPKIHMPANYPQPSTR